MAEDNVMLVKHGYEAFEHGDMEAVLALVDEEIEVVDSPENPDRSTYRHPEGLVANIDNMRAVFDEFRAEPVEFVEVGDVVIASVRMLGRGKESGVQIEARMFHVWTIRDQKAVRLEIYRDRAEAERAAGLEERTA